MGSLLPDVGAIGGTVAVRQQLGPSQSVMESACLFESLTQEQWYQPSSSVGQRLHLIQLTCLVSPFFQEDEAWWPEDVLLRRRGRVVFGVLGWTAGGLIMLRFCA